MILCFQCEDLSQILLTSKLETNWPNISNINWTEWSTIQGVIMRAISKSDECGV